MVLRLPIMTRPPVGRMRWPLRRRLDCRCCAGTEITAVDGNVSVHMLAFQYDPLNANISEMFASTREARLRRTKRMVELIAQDFPITWDDVLAQVREGKRTTIGRPHIADALVAAGVYETRSDAFADAVSATSKYYIPTPSPTTHDVVAAVKGAGGVTVIAHAETPGVTGPAD